MNAPIEVNKFDFGKAEKVQSEAQKFVLPVPDDANTPLVYPKDVSITAPGAHIEPLPINENIGYETVNLSHLSNADRLSIAARAKQALEEEEKLKPYREFDVMLDGTRKIKIKGISAADPVVIDPETGDFAMITKNGRKNARLMHAGGMVDEDETRIDTALRELSEEMGFVVANPENATLLDKPRVNPQDLRAYAPQYDTLKDAWGEYPAGTKVADIPELQEMDLGEDGYPRLELATHAELKPGDLFIMDSQGVKIDVPNLKDIPISQKGAALDEAQMSLKAKGQLMQAGDDAHAIEVHNVTDIADLQDGLRITSSGEHTRMLHHAFDDTAYSDVEFFRNIDPFAIIPKGTPLITENADAQGVLVWNASDGVFQGAETGLTGDRKKVIIANNLADKHIDWLNAKIGEVGGIDALNGAATQALLDEATSEEIGIKALYDSDVAYVQGALVDPKTRASRGSTGEISLYGQSQQSKDMHVDACFYQGTPGETLAGTNNNISINEDGAVIVRKALQDGQYTFDVMSVEQFTKNYISESGADIDPAQQLPKINSDGTVSNAEKSIPEQIYVTSQGLAASDMWSGAPEFEKAGDIHAHIRNTTDKNLNYVSPGGSEQTIEPGDILRVTVNSTGVRFGQIIKADKFQDLHGDRFASTEKALEFINDEERNLNGVGFFNNQGENQADAIKSDLARVLEDFVGNNEGLQSEALETFYASAKNTSRMLSLPENPVRVKTSWGEPRMRQGKGVLSGLVEKGNVVETYPNGGTLGSFRLSRLKDAYTGATTGTIYPPGTSAEEILKNEDLPVADAEKLKAIESTEKSAPETMVMAGIGQDGGLLEKGDQRSK